ncbi:MAG: EamA family transporter, partial [Dokdonella sp.]
TMPFWVVPLAWAILGERVSRRHAIAIAVAAAGLVLVVRPWLGLGGLRSVALALIAGLCWAVGVVLTKRLFRRATVGALSLTAWQMLFGMFGLLVLTWMVPEPPMQWTPYLIGALAYNSILASGLAWVLWAIVVDRLPTHVAGLTSLIIPMVGIGFAWLLLGEQPDMAECLGIVLIAVALFALIARRRETASTMEPTVRPTDKRPT